MTGWPRLRPTLTPPPGQPERERVGFDTGQRGHRVTVDVKGGVAQRRVAAVDRSGPGVAHPQDVITERHRVRRDHPLFVLAEEVVDELQPAVVDEQDVAAVPGACLNNTPRTSGLLTFTSANTENERPTMFTHAPIATGAVFG